MHSPKSLCPSSKSPRPPAIFQIFKPHSSSLKSIKSFSLENKSCLTWKLQSFSAFLLQKLQSRFNEAFTSNILLLLKRTRSCFETFPKRYLLNLHLPIRKTGRMPGSALVTKSELADSYISAYSLRQDSGVIWPNTYVGMPLGHQVKLEEVTLWKCFIGRTCSFEEKQCI